MSLIKRFLFAALALACLASPVNATVVYAGNEDSSATAVGSNNSVDTNSSHHNTWTREGLENGSNSGGDPPTGYWLTPQWASPETSFWAHFATYSSGAGTANNAEAIGFEDPSGVRRLVIRGNGSTGTVKISTRNAAGTLTDLVTCPGPWWPVSGALGHLDVNIVYSSSVGFIGLYYNNVLFCSYSGNITTDSATQLGAVELANPLSSSQSTWSEIIVATTDTRSYILPTCAPSGNGTNQGWTGTASAINPTTINDANNINVTTQPVIGEFTGGSIPSGTFNVVAVAQDLRVANTTGSPQSFEFVVRPATGSTDYFSGAVTAVTAFLNYFNIWNTNPATSTTWTTADIASCMQAGVQSGP